MLCCTKPRSEPQLLKGVPGPKSEGGDDLGRLSGCCFSEIDVYTCLRIFLSDVGSADVFSAVCLRLVGQTLDGQETSFK